MGFLQEAIHPMKLLDGRELPLSFVLSECSLGLQPQSFNILRHHTQVKHSVCYRHGQCVKLIMSHNVS